MFSWRKKVNGLVWWVCRLIDWWLDKYWVIDEWVNGWLDWLIDWLIDCVFAGIWCSIGGRRQDESFFRFSSAPHSAKHASDYHSLLLLSVPLPPAGGNFPLCILTCIPLCPSPYVQDFMSVWVTVYMYVVATVLCLSVQPFSPLYVLLHFHCRVQSRTGRSLFLCFCVPQSAGNKHMHFSLFFLLFFFCSQTSEKKREDE